MRKDNVTEGMVVLWYGQPEGASKLDSYWAIVLKKLWTKCRIRLDNGIVVEVPYNSLQGR